MSVELKQIDAHALMQIKGAGRYLTRQQSRTLRGQVLAGDGDGALRGLRKILLMKNKT